jgi:hypothetical protein
VIPEPVSTAATVVSLANSVRSLFGGGGGKVSSVHQGWRVQGALTRDGLTGTNTAWDQLGNTWGGAVEAGYVYGDVFREYLGDSDVSIPVDLTVSAGEGYYPGLVRQLREGFAALSLQPVDTPMQTAPVSNNLPTEPVPVSRFEPVAPPPAPLPITGATPATNADEFAWSRFWDDLFPTVPANNAAMPSANVIPMSLQRPASNPAGAAPAVASSTSAAPAALPANYTTLALVAVAAYVLVHYLNRDE